MAFDMTSRKLKNQRISPRSIHDVCRSENFWRGFIDGFSAHKFLLGECNRNRLLGKDDSLYQAWVEVGDLLTDSMAEYENGEASKTKPATNARRVEFTGAN